ncbi:MAG: acyl-CoA thioesterase [Bacteroidota bacterium]
MTKKSVTEIEVRYAETDQMGIVHHGVYPQYFELGRVAWLNQYGMHYSEMEKSGIMLPVVDLQIKYHKPARFGDLLSVETSLLEKPGVKITFLYEVYNNKAEELLVKGRTTLVFVDAQTRKPMRCPANILDVFGFTTD